MEYSIITETSFEKARKAIKKAKSPIIFTSNDDDLNRKILEKLGKDSLATSSKSQSKEKIDVLLINLKTRKDWQKQRNSGFNQVMAKEAKKNNVIIGINLDEISSSKGKPKAEILARIKQNIKLCNKAKLQMTFIGKKDPYDLKALGAVLGMPTWMLKEFN